MRKLETHAHARLENEYIRGTFLRSMLSQNDHHDLNWSENFIRTYLELLLDLLVADRLQKLHSNLGKHKVKGPNIYMRDSSECLTLVGIESMTKLLVNPATRGG